MVTKKVILGGSLTSVLAILIYLSTLQGVTITTSGDIRCEGTLTNPCISYFNISSSYYTLKFFDASNQKLSFSPEVKDYKMYRLSGKSWVLTNFPINMTKGVTYQFKIIGYKYDSFDNVKWGVQFGNTKIDPLWFGIGEYHPVSIAGREYTPTCLTECHLPINITLYNDLTTDKSKLTKTIKAQIGKFEIIESGIDYLVNDTYKETIPNCTTQDFKVTEPNGTSYVKSVQFCYPYQENIWKYVWKPVPNNVNIKANNPYIIDLWVKKKASSGISSIDVVPKIKDYELTKMAWWNSTWDNRILINITNNDAQTLKKYHTINITFDTTSLSCDALRIVYNDNTELNMTVHNDTLDFIDTNMGTYCGRTNTTIYFMLQSDIASSTFDDTHYYIYYNNNTEVGKYPNDLDRVFLFFDNFNRVDLGSSWAEKNCGSSSGLLITDNKLTSTIDNVCGERNITVGSLSDLTGWDIYISDYQNNADGYNEFSIRNTSDSTWTGISSYFNNMGYILYDFMESSGFFSVVLSKQVGIYQITTIKKQAWYHSIGQLYNKRIVKQDGNGEFAMWVNTTDSFIKDRYFEWNVTNNTDSSTNTAYALVWWENRLESTIDNILMRRYINTQPTITLGTEENNITKNLIVEMPHQIIYSTEDTTTDSNLPNSYWNNNYTLISGGYTSVISSGTITTNNNSQSSWNETFFGNRNFWIRIKKASNVTYAYLNLSGYQSPTGSNRPYTYSCDNGWCADYTLAYDDGLNDTSTYSEVRGIGQITSSSMTYYFNNYSTTIFYSYNGTIGVWGIQLYNYTKGDYDSVGLNAGPLKVNSTALQPDYMDSNGNVKLRMVSGGATAAFLTKLWDTYIIGGNYTTNPYLDVGNDGNLNWNQTGIFNTLNNKTSDVASDMNTYLSICSPDIQGYCNVPFVLYSDSLGIIRINAINISYTSTTANWTINPSRYGWYKFPVNNLNYFDTASLNLYQQPTLNNSYGYDCNSSYPCVTNLYYSSNQTWSNISWNTNPSYYSYSLVNKNLTSNNTWVNWTITSQLKSVLANITYMLRIPMININLKAMNFTKSNQANKPYILTEVTKYLINESSCVSNPQSLCYQNGTFTPKGQTNSQWIWNVTDVGVTNGSVYAGWNQTLPTCMNHFLSLNSTLETGVDYNVRTTSSVPLGTLTSNQNITYWGFFILNNCTPGVQINSSLVFS